jgi:hypothetical protein
MFFQGAGGARPGMWSRTLCVEEGLNIGSMLPYVERAIAKNYGVVIFNPFCNKVLQSDKGVSRLVPVIGCETPQKHVLTVWDIFVSQAKNCDLHMIANGFGCDLAMHLVESRSSVILSRLHAIAFSESTYVPRPEISESIKLFIRKRSLNWCSKKPTSGDSASEDIRTGVPMKLYVDITKKWDGNSSRTVAASIGPIFRWLDEVASADITADVTSVLATKNKKEVSAVGSTTTTPLLSGVIAEDSFVENEEYRLGSKLFRSGSSKKSLKPENENDFNIDSDTGIIHFSECSSPGNHNSNIST